jgi:stage V sporulation protein B
MASSNPVKRQSFLQGAAILALATAVVKIIGACYKIPLGIVIGDAGYGYFTTAYDIYSVLLMISTTGLPVAMSRMISEARTLDRSAQIRKIYRTSLMVFLILGVVGSGGMLILCKPLAGWMNSPNSWIAIASLAPALFFICLISAYRGFFQGQSNMTPTAVSQVFEALSKLIIGLTIAWIIMKRTHNAAAAAGGAIVGVTIGCIISASYLGIKHRAASRELAADGGETDSTSKTAKTLLSIAIPITLGSAGLQIINLIDAKIVMQQLLGPAGFLQEDADVLKGIYNFCQTIFNLPCAFITPLTVSIIPAVTEHLTLKDRKAARSVEESGLRIMSLLSMPCAMGLAVLAGPILQMLRGYEGANLKTGAVLLAVLGVAVVFNSLVLLTNAIMQAHGYVSLPVISMIIGGIVKIIINYILVGRPGINIMGAPIGTLCCYMTISALNLLVMRRVVNTRPRVLSTMLKPLAAAAAMGAAAFLVCEGLTKLLPQKLACLIAICIAGAVYVALVVVLKIITPEDLALLPGSEKIAKLLRLK